MLCSFRFISILNESEVLWIYNQILFPLVWERWRG